MKTFPRILVIIILVFSLFPFTARSEVVDRIVAIVNDDIITMKELESFVHLDKQTRFSSINEYLAGLKLEEKLGIFIEGVLIKQQARKLKVDVGDRELEGIVENIKKQNLITDAELRDQLKKEGINYDSFVEGIRMNMLKSRVVARVISSETNVSDQTLKEFYERNKETFREEEYHLKQIYISGQKADGEKRAMEAYGLLEKRPFEDVAREYSDDPSAKQGGDIGFVKGEDLLPVLRESLQNLGKDQYTQIVITPYGFHILKLVELKRSDIVAFNAVKERIQERIVFQESEKRYRQYMDKLKRSSYIEVKI